MLHGSEKHFSSAGLGSSAI